MVKSKGGESMILAFETISLLNFASLREIFPGILKWD